MAGQVGFHVEQDRCIGCFTCQIACKDKNDLEVGQRWRRVEEIAGGGYTRVGEAIRGNVYAYWISISCNHCQDPLCVKNCPTGAMYKRPEDGVVLVDERKCIGCRYCTWSCPYGAPQYDPGKGKVGKCNFCVDLVEKGEEPACVAACPMRALHAGDLEELARKYGGTSAIKGLPDPKLTKPSLLISPHRHAVDK